MSSVKKSATPIEKISEASQTPGIKTPSGEGEKSKKDFSRPVEIPEGFLCELCAFPTGHPIAGID
jgi:hypothetical protein